MRFAVVAHRRSATNDLLAGARAAPRGRAVPANVARRRRRPDARARAAGRPQAAVRQLGTRRPALPQADELDGARAVRGDLVGVDLLPTPTAFVVSEVNGAVDFTPSYGLGLEDVFVEAALEPVRVARARLATRTASA